MSDQQKSYEMVAFPNRDVSTIFILVLLYVGTFATLWAYGDWLQLSLAMFLTPALIWLSVRDLQTFELPDFSILAIVVIGFAHVSFADPEALLFHIGIAISVTVFFWCLGEVYFRRFGHEGLGIGDAKLFGAGALLLGPWYISELVLLPSLGGIAFYLMLRLRGREAISGVPFGPFIAYAIFILSFLNPLFA